MQWWLSAPHATNKDIEKLHFHQVGVVQVHRGVVLVQQRVREDAQSLLQTGRHLLARHLLGVYDHFNETTARREVEVGGDLGFDRVSFDVHHHGVGKLGCVGCLLPRDLVRLQFEGQHVLGRNGLLERRRIILGETPRNTDP